MTTEQILTEIHATLQEILELLKAVYPEDAKRLGNPWEGVFKPIEGVSDEVARWGPND